MGVKFHKSIKLTLKYQSACYWVQLKVMRIKQKLNMNPINWRVTKWNISCHNQRVYNWITLLQQNKNECPMRQHLFCIHSSGPRGLHYEWQFWVGGGITGKWDNLFLSLPGQSLKWNPFFQPNCPTRKHSGRFFCPMGMQNTQGQVGFIFCVSSGTF